MSPLVEAVERLLAQPQGTRAAALRPRACPKPATGVPQSGAFSSEFKEHAPRPESSGAPDGAGRPEGRERAPEGSGRSQLRFSSEEPACSKGQVGLQWGHQHVRLLLGLGEKPQSATCAQAPKMD